MTAQVISGGESWLSYWKDMGNGFNGAYLSAISGMTSSEHCNGSSNAGLTTRKIVSACGLLPPGRLPLLSLWVSHRLTPHQLTSSSDLRTSVQ
jgi:hypothetical protein